MERESVRLGRIALAVSVIAALWTLAIVRTDTAATRPQTQPNAFEG